MFQFTLSPDKFAHFVYFAYMNKLVIAYSDVLIYRLENFHKQGEREMLLTEISLLRNHVCLFSLNSLLLDLIFSSDTLLTLLYV